MDKISIGLHGSSGRICQEIINLSSQRNDIIISYAYSRSGKNNDLDKLFCSCDVVIDFSNYKTTSLLLKKALQYKKKLVIGTTGISPKSFVKIKSISTLLPIFYSANLSPGIFIVTKMLKIACSLLALDKYDINIIETHHKQKQDAPSGTALMLLNEIMSNQNIKKSSKALSASNNITSIREGFALGTHEMLFTSEYETISIKHQTCSRKLFAIQALDIAKWIYNQHPGLYNIEDYITQTSNKNL